MAIFEVQLEADEQKEPGRSGPITVDAKDASAAKAFAEEQNPGLKATEAKELK